MDVLPVPIGIGVVGGKFQPVLAANTPLPAKATIYVRNETNDAQTIQTSIFQGDAANVAAYVASVAGK